jgi:hypothetical protein
LGLPLINFISPAIKFALLGQYLPRQRFFVFLVLVFGFLVFGGMVGDLAYLKTPKINKPHKNP